MPLPMVHLAVAIRVQEILGWRLDGEYLLGNLAPDAIHMRAASGRSDKDASHFHVGTLPEKEAFAAISKLLQKEYAASQIIPSFRTGYALHLLTDHFWTQGNVAAFIDRLPKTMPDTEKRTLYYRETDQVDVNLYRQMSWRPKVWDMLACTVACDFDDLLTAQEIQKWLARDLNWFEKNKEKPRITPIYITDEVAAAFIEHAAEKAALFFRMQAAAPS